MSSGRRCVDLQRYDRTVHEGLLVQPSLSGSCKDG